MDSEFEEEEDTEWEKEKELEEYLYSKVHYASKVDIVDKVNTETESEELESDGHATFPEIQCTTSWEGILGVKHTNEDKSKRLGAVVGEDVDQWDIDDADLDGVKKKKTERYYLPEQLPSIYCFNCGQKGHIGKECTEEKKTLRCYLCGNEGHQRRGCPFELCFNCLGTGHFAKNCQEKKKNRQYLRCHRCQRKGHDDQECSEIWRQFHCTITPGELNTPPVKKARRKNFNRYCYNCASRGHFGEDCTQYRYCIRSVYSQFIVNYDKCPGNPKPEKKLSKDEEKKAKKDEEERKKEKKKQKKAEKQQCKQEEEEARQKKKIEEKERKREEKEKKSKLKKEAEAVEKEKEKLRKEEKRVRKEEEQLSRKRKREESTSSESSSQHTKRSRKSFDMIKANLWVTDDDLRAYKKEENTFSMKDHLNLSSADEEEERGKSKRRREKRKKIDSDCDHHDDRERDEKRSSTKDSRDSKYEHQSSKREDKLCRKNSSKDEHKSSKERENEHKSKSESRETKDEYKSSTGESRKKEHKSKSESRETKDEYKSSKERESEHKSKSESRETKDEYKSSTGESRKKEHKSKSESRETKDEHNPSKRDSKGKDRERKSKNKTRETEDEQNSSKSHEKKSSITERDGTRETHREERSNDVLSKPLNEDQYQSVSNVNEIKINTGENPSVVILSDNSITEQKVANRNVILIDEDSPRKKNARLDYESLQNLKEILHSDDDEDRKITYGKPIPDPQVHFDDSDDGEGDSDGENGDNDEENENFDVNNAFNDDLFTIDDANYISFEDHNNDGGEDQFTGDDDDDVVEVTDNMDLTRYDPTAVYQEHLVKYKLINPTQNHSMGFPKPKANQRGFQSQTSAYRWSRTANTMLRQNKISKEEVIANHKKNIILQKENGKTKTTIHIKYTAKSLKGLLPGPAMNKIKKARSKFIKCNLGIDPEVGQFERTTRCKPHLNAINQHVNKYTENLLKSYGISDADVKRNEAMKLQRKKKRKKGKQNV